MVSRSLERLVKSDISKRVTYRELNLHNLREESDLVCDLYNDGFEGHWGSVSIGLNFTKWRLIGLSF